MVARARVVVGPGLLVGLLLCTTGCYALRTVRGGLEVLVHRRPIDAVLTDPGTSPELARRLRRVQRIRRFAVDELALPDDKSYTRYTHLDRDAAVWTVVAAPELSVASVVWCFPVAGCVSYRGYFSKRAAERYAARFAERGYDVAVDGRAAYSTLGHFADPVLSTFVDYEEPRLAGLIFHELAHRQVYLPGDTAFNESFATAVELAGVERWLEKAGTSGAGDDGEVGEDGPARRYRERQQRERRVTALYLATRDRLAEVYATEKVPKGTQGADSTDLDAWKRRRKTALFDRLRRQLRALGVEPAEPLNNARLASVGPYHRWLDAFEALIAREGGDFAAFYRHVERLAELPEVERRGALEALQTRESAPAVQGPAAGSSVDDSGSAASSCSLVRALRLSGFSSSDLR